MRFITPFTVTVLLSLLLTACDSSRESSGTEASPAPEQGQPAAKAATPPEESATDAGNVVDVTIKGLSFTAPDKIPSGWTTFRMKNESAMVHFAIVERMPEGKGLEAQQEEVAPIFQQGMDLLNEGDQEAASVKFGELPAWFGDIVFMGGPGLTAAGRTSQATVRLEPGRYLLECYVKTGGIFHSYNPNPDQYGMVHEFTVTEQSTGAPEPEADVDIVVSSGGLEVSGNLVPGEHIVAVHFKDQKHHENFVGHDVHVARLEDDTNMARLQNWMDWRQQEGLQSPAPVTFVGGTNEMPVGQTTYFTVTLLPGRYAFISETPEADAKGLMKVVEIAAGQDVTHN